MNGATQVEKKEKRTRKENLSTRDIEDLMGIHGRVMSVDVAL